VLRASMGVVSRGMMVTRDLPTCHVFDLKEAGIEDGGALVDFQRSGDAMAERSRLIIVKCHI
jgi:hypothetical protein